MKHTFKFLTLITLALFVGACGLTDLDLLNDPAAVTPDNAELDLVYNNVMKEFVDFVDEASDETMPYVRMTAMSGGFQYNNQDGPGDFNFLWNQAFTVLMPDINLCIDLASESGFTVHSGSAKILKAYTMFTLVDLFGDIPYSEAFQGVQNPSPKADDDESVYNAALALLDEAISELGSPKGSPVNDLYYGGDADSWIALANSLKLRYYVQTRLVNSGAGSAINGLLGQNIIDSEGEDFQFEYGTNRQTPDSRHPYYSDGYEVGGPSWYMSNYYMWQMFIEKGIVDPRIRYYFRRQDTYEDNENQFTLECPAAPYPLHWPDGYPWCTASGDFGDPAGEWGGYWGRNHGDASGIPPDDLKRTAWGLYPAGGDFDAFVMLDETEAENDDSKNVSNSGTDGARGQGIQPIMLTSWVHFLRSEAALTMGTNDNAREQLEAGVRASISKVMGFESRSVVDPAYKPSDQDVEDYVAKVLELYDAATDDDGRLNVIVGEFRLALHGMGLDAYNAYRRTSKPEAMEPTFQANPGPFPRTFWYPADYVNRNSNASQRADLTTKVFWDTNPDDLP